MQEDDKYNSSSNTLPWEIYMAYGNTEVLENQFESMKKRVDYTTRYTKEENLWIGGVHYGDWLALDAEVVIDGVRYEVKAGTYCWKH